MKSASGQAGWEQSLELLNRAQRAGRVLCIDRWYRQQFFRTWGLVALSPSIYYLGVYKNYLTGPETVKQLWPSGVELNVFHLSATIAACGKASRHVGTLTAGTESAQNLEG